MNVCIYIFLTDKGSSLEFYVLKISYRCKVQQPGALQQILNGDGEAHN